MNVNFNFLKPKSTLLNFSAVNNSMSNKSTNKNVHKAGIKNSHDRVSLSPQGKMMNLIETLNKQKENIIENRNKLVTTTLENGGDLDNIKEQLKLYSKQLQDIDKQISDIQSQNAKAEIDKNKKDNKATEKNKNKYKTDTQVEIENLTNIANISEDVKSSQKITSLKNSTDNEVNIKKAELHMDQLQIDNLESKYLTSKKSINVQDLINNINKAMQQKQESISALREKSDSINSIQIKKLSESLEKLNEESDSNEYLLAEA